MAKKKLTAADIAKILQISYGGGVVQPRALLGALLSSPTALESLRSRAAEDVEPFQRFDPEQVYDPTTNVNDVLLKYQMMMPQYAELAQGFLGGVAKQGGSDAAKTALTSELKKRMAEAGVPEQDALQLSKSLQEDADKYMKAELSRKKKQMSAFYKMRKEKGLSAVPGSGDDVGEFLEAQTGLEGLSDIPTSLEQVAKQKSSEFAKSLAGRGRADTAGLVAAFERKFLEGAKKKGLKAQQFTPKDVVAKLLGGL